MRNGTKKKRTATAAEERNEKKKLNESLLRHFPSFLVVFVVLLLLYKHTKVKNKFLRWAHTESEYVLGHFIHGFTSIARKDAYNFFGRSSVFFSPSSSIHFGLFIRNEFMKTKTRNKEQNIRLKKRIQTREKESKTRKAKKTNSTFQFSYVLLLKRIILRNVLIV